MYQSVDKRNFVAFVGATLSLYFPLFPLIPLKKSENQRFSDVFRGIRREHWEVKGY